MPRPDGRILLATGSHDGTVRLWDPAMGKEFIRLVTGAPVHTICAGAPEPAGGFLAFGGPAGVAALDLTGFPG